MNIRKFIAPTARQALRDIRDELGDEAVILSNRKVGDGVEIIAMANDTMEQLTDRATVQKATQPSASPVAHAGVHAIARPLQQIEPIQRAKPMQQVKPAQQAKPVQQMEPIQQDKPAASQFPVSQMPVSPVQSTDGILGEIKTMHDMLQQQLAAMSWGNVQQRDPQSAGLLHRMLNSGFSALLARQLMDKLPTGKAHGEKWIRQVLKRNLCVAGPADDIIAKGGVYALIGPTGVGKTTTTAKLAARAVVRYGADKVALLTTDSYRIGAYEQLKIYGKILGVAVHAVKDTDDLRRTLSSLSNKHLVLIDTLGMGQRDERVGDQSEMFDAVGVQRLLLLNATSSGNTLEDVADMYHSNKVIGCIATKLDEAASLGALLDVAVRHRLVLHYMTNGQRVPEDLHPVNLDYLLHRALKPVKQITPFTLHELEFPVLMAGSRAVAEAVHAR